MVVKFPHKCARVLLQLLYCGVRGHDALECPNRIDKVRYRLCESRNPDKPKLEHTLVCNHDSRAVCISAWLLDKCHSRWNYTYRNFPENRVVLDIVFKELDESIRLHNIFHFVANRALRHPQGEVLRSRR